MTVLRHELRANRVSALIWCGVIVFMMMLTMLMYPSFKDQMASVSAIFAMMGPFTKALGMDILPLGTAVGFYGIESGTMLSLGGTMFAAFTGIALLSKEEAGHTAEFLLAQPVSRRRVVLEKIGALLVLLVLFNAACLGFGLVSFALIGEPVPMGPLLRFHAMQLLLHAEVGVICLGLSAVFSRTQTALGLGIAILLYFLSLLMNMVDRLSFLRYVTPFAYADAAAIFSGAALSPIPPLVGIGVIALFALLATLAYDRKDIAA